MKKIIYNKPTPRDVIEVTKCEPNMIYAFRPFDTDRNYHRYTFVYLANVNEHMKYHWCVIGDRQIWNSDSHDSLEDALHEVSDCKVYQFEDMKEFTNWMHKAINE